VTGLTLPAPCLAIDSGLFVPVDVEVDLVGQSPRRPPEFRRAAPAIVGDGDNRAIGGKDHVSVEKALKLRKIGAELLFDVADAVAGEKDALGATACRSAVAKSVKNIDEVKTNLPVLHAMVGVLCEADRRLYFDHGDYSYVYVKQRKSIAAIDIRCQDCCECHYYCACYDACQVL